MDCTRRSRAGTRSTVADSADDVKYRYGRRRLRILTRTNNRPAPDRVSGVSRRVEIASGGDWCCLFSQVHSTSSTGPLILDLLGCPEE